MTLDQMQGLTSIDPRWKAIHEDGSDFPGETHPAMVALQTGKPVYNVVMGIYLFESDSYRWINVNAMPRFNPGEDLPYEVYASFEDITERKQAERKLSENEVLLLQVLESVPDSTFALDLDYRLLIDNKRHQQELVASGGHLLVVGEKMLSPDYPAEVLEFWRAAYERTLTGEIFSLESPWVDINGQSHVHENRFAPLRDTTGAIIGVLVVAHDITERKRLEESQRESEQKYTMLFQKSTVPTILIKLPEVVVFDANEAYETLTGFTRQEMFGKTSVELGLFKPEQRKELVARFDSEGGLQSREGRLYSRDGKEHVVVMNTTPVEIGGKTYAITTMQDITERRRAEEQLRESEEFLRLAYEAADLGIWKNDLRTGSVEFDERARIHYGFDTLHTTLSEVTNRVHPEDVARLGAEIAAATAPTGNGKFATEYRVIHPDGNVHWLAIGVQVTFEGEGEGRRSVMGYGTSLDITERKLAEEALREREQKLNTILNLLPVGVSILDQDRNVTYANDALGKILGTTREGLARGEYRNRKYLRADGSEKPVAEFASTRVFSERIEVHDVITGVVKEDAQTVWTSVSGAPVDFPDWKVVLVTSDITKRKQMEDALQQSEEKYAALFRKAAVPAALTKMPEGVFADVNDAFQTVFGYRREEIIGKTSIEIGMAQPKERTQTFIELEKYGQLIGNEKHLFTKTGEPRIGAINVSKVKIDGLDYVITTIHEVTEQKLAEQALKQRTEELKQLLELLPTAIWIAEDPECKIIRGNRYANELLGASRNDNVSQSSETATVRLRQFSKDKELTPDELPMQVAARTGQPQVDFELHIERSDEIIRTLIGGAVPLFDSVGKPRGAVAGFHDITDLKKTEEELRRSNAELEQFAYVASHDLQEPLRTLAGMVQLLQKRYQGQLDERAEEYIGHAVEAASRMQALIKDLLAYSRVDRRNQPIEPVSAQDCLQIALKNLGASIRESHATIIVNDLPIVHADPTQLTQLFQNLIGNSIKFRGEREPHVQITATQLNDAWQFSVSDNGIGIEEQYFERIFLVFQRLHTRRQYQGTGIGLALCKKIVERHGGSIRVESHPGEGSTFYFTLPIRSTP